MNKNDFFRTVFKCDLCKKRIVEFYSKENFSSSFDLCVDCFDKLPNVLTDTQKIEKIREILKNNNEL